MYAALLERILGYAGSERASLPSSSGTDGGVPSLLRSEGARSSAQYKALTRPYRCSTSRMVPHLDRASSSAINCDGDGASAYSYLAGDGKLSVSKTGEQSCMSFSSSTMPSRRTSTSTTPVVQASGATLHHSKAMEAVPLCGNEGISSVRQCAPANNVSRHTTAPVGVSASGRSEHAWRFEEALRASTVDLALLRKLSWGGCPVALRYETWMLLTGCWTAQSAMRQATVSRRRIEYAAYIDNTYGIVDWDAVCALVDSGVDTAVHRSTLKSLEHNTSVSRGVGTPMEMSLTEMMATSLGSSLRLFRGSALAPGAATATGIKVAASCSSQPYLRGLVGVQRSVSSPEDGYVSVEQNTKGNDVQPPSHWPGQQIVESRIMDCSAGSLSNLFGSSLRVDVPLESTGSGGTSPLPNPTSSVSSCPASSTRRLAKPVIPSAFHAVGDGAGTATGHRLTASTMLGSAELQTLKQIRKDIPRMSGGHCYLRHPRVQASVERILFIWSLRHPACGYVQGMNDLVVPFMGVVLGYRFCPTRSITELHAYTKDIFDELWSVSAVSVTQWINEVEADVYWMTSYLLNTIQDNYISGHAGITAMMRHLAAIVQAADPPLYHCLNVMQINFEQFSFKWMNCLLMRELTETQSLRLLDAYLSDEERRWSVTHVYVCAALLLRWGPQIMALRNDYVSAMKFLQSPPTVQMSLIDMQDVLSEGFLLQKLYEDTVMRLSAAGER